MRSFANKRVARRLRVHHVYSCREPAADAAEGPGATVRGALAGVRFLVWGAGGHGRVVGELILALGGRVVGFMDAKAGALGTVRGFEQAKLITEQPLAQALRDGSGQPLEFDAVALGIGNNAMRLRCLAALSSVEVPPLVHPSAVVSPSAVLGRGCVVLARAVVGTGARLGDAVVVNTAGVVEHDCSLSDGVHVATGAVLAGGVRLGARCWVGAGATVIQQLAVGADALVGAGAVVIRDVQPGTTVVGVPASRTLHRH